MGKYNYELKSCPFCNNIPTLRASAKNPYYDGLLVYARITCDYCGCSNQHEIEYRNFELDQSKREFKESWKEKYNKEVVEEKTKVVADSIVKWWNTRA